MKRTATGQPFLSFCLIVRNCADTLEVTLKSIRARAPQAEIVIVDTMSCDLCAADRLAGRKIKHEAHYGFGDPTVLIALKYADVFEQYRGPEETWNEEMYAFDDAAAARNRAFSLASGKWRGWIDADDELVGPEEVERLLKLNNRWKDTTPDWAKNEEAPREADTLEGLLAFVEKEYPEVVEIWCPYLYESDPTGLAVSWQDRERFIKWNAEKPTHVWREPAHEVLVPIDPNATLSLKKTFLPQVLYVHRKQFTLQDREFSTRRHFAIMKKNYDAGRRVPRDLLYLADQAQALEPHNVEKYIEEAHAFSNTTLDRMRALAIKGDLAAQRGLYFQAKELFAAAITFRPDLPDAFVKAGDAALLFEDYIWAHEMFAAAIKLKVTVESMPWISPRGLALKVPAQLAKVAQKIGEMHVSRGDHDSALTFFRSAETLLGVTANHSAAGPDALELWGYWKVAREAADAQQAAMDFARTADFLIRSDETQKALEMIKLVPVQIEDHPLVVAVERRLKALPAHLTDAKAYDAFYEGIGLTEPQDGSAGSDLLNPATALDRTRMLIAHVGARNIDVLEVGPYDGVVTIPAMRACPNARFTVVDASTKALERMRQFADELVPDKQARLAQHNAAFLPQRQDPRPLDRITSGFFDVVVLFEVIEHLPEPEIAIASLLSKVRNGGRLFVSTPWQAYDRGTPENMKDRDPRGHVRALSPRRFVEIVEAAGGKVVQLFKSPGRFEIGATLQAEIRHASSSYATGPRTYKMRKDDLTFVVSASLWDWNSRSLERAGMGASEETIIYMGRELAKDRNVALYGPVGEAEVHDELSCWPREQIRKLDPRTPVVISRAPSFIDHVEREVDAKLARPFLWLQDAHYADLNEKVAARYEKIIVLTEWHKQAMHEQHNVPLEKMAVIGNFLLPSQYNHAVPVKRRPRHFIYSSSPDRGLIQLLKLWPHVLRKYPDATLDVFYGWRGCIKLSSNPSWMARYGHVRKEYEALRWQSGVTERGMVSHAQIAYEMRTAAVWAYPTDFAETFCSNAIKARAAGCVPVAPMLAALAETASCAQTRVIRPWFAHAEHDANYVEEFMDAVEKAIETPEDQRLDMAINAIEEHSIERVAPLWRALLDGGE